jgi:hypothetical protein
MQKTVICIGLLCFFPSDAHAVHPSGRLLFHSGFEPDTRLTNESSGWIDIVGVDHSLNPPNDWAKDFGQGPLGTFRFQYAGGDTTKRRVTIEQDPANSSNHVLRYWMQQVNVKPNASYGGKGRIQANVAGNSKLRNFYYRVRLYFHSDWRHLQNWREKMGWFILAEFWNNANWTREGHPFRIHITISNNPGSDDGLQFGVGAQIEKRGWKGIWHESNETYSIPLDQWLTAEIYLKEGKNEKGRFYFAMTEPNGDKTIIVDVHNTTHHPDDPAPDGFTQFNPMKLYTHNKNIHRVRNQGGALQIYWDDFELWTGKTP